MKAVIVRNYQLSDEALNVICAGLGKLPAEISFGVLQDLETQRKVHAKEEAISSAAKYTANQEHTKRKR